MGFAAYESTLPFQLGLEVVPSTTSKCLTSEGSSAGHLGGTGG